jgi:hypothetical protein
MANLIKTTRTYASYENAEAALRRAAGDIDLADLRYLIAANPDGRFAPVVLVNQTHLPHIAAIAFAHRGVTVVG